MSPESSTPEPGTQFPGAVYATDSVPVLQRRSYWREALSRTFAAVDITVADEACSGTIRTSPLGRLRLATADGGPLRAWRSQRLIAQGDGEERVVVSLVAKGVVGIEQDGREVRLRPGEFAFCDMARPIRMEFPEPYRTKSLVLPRHLLGVGEEALRRLTGTSTGPDTVLGSLLSPFLSRLVDTAARCPSRTGDALARHVVDLLGVLAEERLRGAPDDTESAAPVLVLRIKAFVDRRLADPDLTPEAIARAHHISVRYLHRLFQSEDDTVGRWIQRRRLQECRRELAGRGAADRTIAAVAHQWGFVSAAHFSRVFRAAYGMSPAQWRESAVRAPLVLSARGGHPPARHPAPAAPR
ncbi:helix-turn-helix domain-containing protein [Streptomyces sp. NBC_00704]|uniref:AraC-like ligand-binding domain-containing protein n=1 Tax=Streptomyces sp. NBC_00704 TaxID=2975809 RepID=UPI002E34EBF1|nr:helix-turn-helix domain-containing protein [Streptomyces sp. NBC_00704]